MIVRVQPEMRLFALGTPVGRCGIVPDSCPLGGGTSSTHCVEIVLLVRPDPYLPLRGGSLSPGRAKLNACNAGAVVETAGAAAITWQCAIDSAEARQKTGH